jgi:hypothetical protein
LNSGNFFSAATQALIRKASIVTLTPLLVLLVGLHAEGFQVGDVGVVVVGDVRES